MSEARESDAGGSAAAAGVFFLRRLGLKEEAASLVVGREGFAGGSEVESYLVASQSGMAKPLSSADSLLTAPP